MISFSSIEMVMLLKYIGAIAISSVFLFPAKKNIAQTIPYDTTSITNLLEKKEEGLGEVYEDPSFEAQMSIDAKLDKDLFEGIVVKEPYGGIELTGKVAEIFVGGSYSVEKTNGSTILNISKEKSEDLKEKGKEDYFQLSIEFEKLYDNCNKNIDTKSIIYYGKTSFDGVDLEGVVIVNYVQKEDSLNLKITGRLNPVNFWDSWLFGFGKLIGKVPDDEDIARWNKSLQKDFTNAANKISDKDADYQIFLSYYKNIIGKEDKEYLLKLVKN